MTKKASKQPVAKKWRRVDSLEATRRKVRRTLEPISPGDQAMFSGYICSKASTMGELGIEGYRSQDSLGRPSAGLDEALLDALRSGCAQLVAGRGLAPETPLQELSVAGCYALLETLHFKVVGRQTQRTDRTFLDELRCEHQVSGFRGSLFNRVVYSD
jgi:hypothetical protein